MNSPKKMKKIPESKFTLFAVIINCYKSIKKRFLNTNKCKFLKFLRIYFNEFSLRNLINISVIPILIYLLYVFFAEYYDKTFLAKIIMQFNTNDKILNSIFIFMALYSFYYILNKIRYGLIPSFNSIVAVLMVAVLYFYISRVNSKYEFYHFLNTVLFFFDIFVFWILIWFLDFRSYKLPLEIQNNKSIVKDLLEFDKSRKNLPRDDYYREQYAQEIADVVENTTSSESSISIGIFSEWGTGKTDFINRLKIKFSQNKDNIMFDFNPWLLDSSRSFSEEYFSSLSKILKQYNNSITRRIKSYTNKILNQAKQVEFKLLESFIFLFFKEKTMIEERDEINQTLKNTGKRVIVFIDDADRITGKELLQLFKLIRNSGSFSNTFFITTLDYNFTLDALKSTKEISNEEEYIKKIFNLFLRLPVIIKENLANEIYDLFVKDFENDREKISLCLKKLGYKFKNLNRIIKYEGLIEKILKNSRDVKLFYNSSKLHYRILKDQIEIIDLFILELLKVNNFALYNRLSNEEFIKCYFDKDYLELASFPTESTKNSINEYQETHLDKYLLGQNVPIGFYDGLFKSLLSKGKKSLGQFADPINFNLYFSHTLPNNIVPRDLFYISLKDSDEFFLDKINEWKELKTFDLSSIFMKFNFFVNEDYLRKFIKFYLKFSEELKLNQDRLNLFYNEFPNAVNSYKLTIENKKDFIFEILNCHYLPFQKRMSLGNIFLRQHLEVEKGVDNKTIGLKGDWTSIMVKLFENASKDQEQLKIDIFLNSLYKIIEKIDCLTTKDSLNHEACLIYKNLLLDNNIQFEFYIKFFFRAGFLDFSSKREFFHEPLLKSIFPDINEFIDELEASDFEADYLRKLKEIILKIDFQRPQNLAIEFSSNEDYEFVNSFNNKMYEKDENTNLDEDELFNFLSNIGSIK